MGVEMEDNYTKDGTTDIHGNPADRKKTGNWRACPYILANESCERLAFYGMSTNLVNYLKNHLNQGNSSASRNVNNWSGTCYIMRLFGAFVADAYWGRYWTIVVFMILYINGLVLLTMTASLKGLKPVCHSDMCDPTTRQVAAVFVSLYLIAVGTGGIKPCVPSFGADQFDESDESGKKSKASFFNWFYFSVNIGGLISSFALVYVQTHVGWSWGFGIPAAMMAIAVATFFFGTPLYRHQRPGGSPLTRIAQVIVASIRKSGAKIPSDKSLLYELSDRDSAIDGSRKLEHTELLKFFDKAAVKTEEDKAETPVNQWKLCTVTQVEELKSVVRLLPIWASGIIFSVAYSQMSTMFVLQGNTLDPHMGPNFVIPSASLSIFDTISIIFWVPIYDRIIILAVRKVTGNERGFTQLTRIGIGLFISIFAMVAAEVFTFIGKLEFFYDQAPDAMRTICSALSLSAIAVGNYLSSLLVTIVASITTKGGKLGWIPDNLNRGHLDYFYWLLAVLSFANFLVYLLIARSYKYKKPVQV